MHVHLYVSVPPGLVSVFSLILMYTKLAGPSCSAHSTISASVLVGVLGLQVPTLLHLAFTRVVGI